jgi:hypothetical protein
MAAVRKVYLAFALMATTNELLKLHRHIKFNTEADHKLANTFITYEIIVPKSTRWAIGPLKLVDAV